MIGIFIFCVFFGVGGFWFNQKDYKSGFWVSLMIRKDIFLVERNNEDTKKYKIIHPFDGRLIPLKAGVLSENSQILADKLNWGKANYVVGFAEGGILSAYGVAEAIGIPLIGSYRVRLKASNELHFKEPHSARSDHYIYGLKKGDRIIIVEDEITTGSTLLNALREFKKNGIVVDDVGAFILGGEVKNLDKICAEGFQLKYLFGQNDF